MLPIEGGFSEWSDWSVCSATCGLGEQYKRRSCTNPKPSFDGRNCSSLGSTEEVRSCNITSCPGKTLCRKLFPEIFRFFFSINLKVKMKGSNILYLQCVSWNIFKHSLFKRISNFRLYVLNFILYLFLINIGERMMKHDVSMIYLVPKIMKLRLFLVSFSILTILSLVALIKLRSWK